MTEMITTDAAATATSGRGTISQEHADLLESLARHRYFLRFTVQKLTDDQARSHPVASSVLTLGGLIKHVTAGESQWMEFAVKGAQAMGSTSPDVDWTDTSDPYIAEWANGFTMLPDETLEGLLAAYEARAAETEALLPTLDLDAAHKLPEAPWFEQGKSWTVRRCVLHIIAETSQHAGHADFLREAIDGQKTMG
jgi:uncharacterized damage-inducible protein DinB